MVTFEPLPRHGLTNRVPRAVASVDVEFVLDNANVAVLIAFYTDGVDDDLTRDDVDHLVTLALRRYGLAALHRERPADFHDRLVRAVAHVRRLYPEVDDEVLDDLAG